MPSATGPGVAPTVNRDGSPRFFPWWLRLAVPLASLVLCLVVCEIAVRLLSPQDLDFYNTDKISRPSVRPGQGYEYIPNTFNKSLAGVPVRINNLGFRGTDVQIPKPAGTIRILGIGDSVAFGFGVRNEDTFLKVLEKKLNERTTGGVRFEVVNAAVDATGLAYYYFCLRDVAARLEPDWVIVSVVMNDIDRYRDLDSYEYLRRQPPKQSLVRRVNRALLLHSHLYLLTYMRLKSLLYQTGMLNVLDLGGFELLAVEPPSQEREKAWQATTRVLSRIVALARQRNYRLIIVFFPAEMQMSQAALQNYEKLLRVRLDREAVNGEPQRRLAGFARAQDVEFLDLFPPFRSADQQHLFLRNRTISLDPIHPSSLGHRIAGEELARRMILLMNKQD